MLKICLNCRKKFETNRTDKKMCSYECTNKRRVDLRYARENGDFPAYFKALLSKKDNPAITVEELMEMLEAQNYRCALSGMPLECSRTRGKRNPYNVSLDRKIPGGEYNKDNVQLVCQEINSWKGIATTKEFVNMCRRVTENAIRKQKETTQKRISTAARKG